MKLSIAERAELQVQGVVVPVAIDKVVSCRQRVLALVKTIFALFYFFPLSIFSTSGFHD